jgi:hypothetical protein
LKDIAQPHPHKLPAIVPSEATSNYSYFASMQCLRIYSTNHLPDEQLKLQATSPRRLHPESRNTKSAQARSTPPQSTHNLKSTSRLHKGPLQKRVKYHHRNHRNRPRHPHHLPLSPSILSARTHKPHKQASKHKPGLLRSLLPRIWAKRGERGRGRLVRGEGTHKRSVGTRSQQHHSEDARYLNMTSVLEIVSVYIDLLHGIN